MEIPVLGVTARLCFLSKTQAWYLDSHLHQLQQHYKLFEGYWSAKEHNRDLKVPNVCIVLV